MAGMACTSGSAPGCRGCWGALTATAGGPFARPLSQAAETIRPGGDATRRLIPMVQLDPDVIEFTRLVVRSDDPATQPAVKTLDTQEAW